MANDPPTRLDVTHTALSVLFLALLATGSFLVLRPFLSAIIWATVFSVAVWPQLMRLDAAFGGRRWLAVFVVIIAILLAVFVPITLALVTIVRHAYNMTGDIQSLQAITMTPPAWLAHVPLVGARIAGEWRRLAALTPEARATEFTPYAQAALQWFASTAGSLGATLVQFLLTTIVSTVMLARGEVASDGILRFAERLAGQRGRDLAILAAKAIRGVVLGVVGTALIQTAIGGAGMLIAGIPAAGLLSAVMLFLCLAQIGPMPVLVPAVAWLYWSGRPGWGTTLLVFAIVTGTIDNVIRPALIRRGANLPLVLIFAGVIGGLIAFGIVGLFVGPVVLTVSYTVLASWTAEGDRPPAAGQSA